jgi:radical SAM protein with 4Fe4S-binding SPASM domain
MPPAGNRTAAPESDRLVYVVWELTLRCDHACAHCGSRAFRARPDELSTDEALDVVRQLAELGAEEITLIGGEAYLRHDWTTIARAIADAGIRCTMTTGGKGLDRARARAAREAGISAVSVSVDGLRAAHDRQRGAGSFEAAMAALRALRDEGVPSTANTQVNRLTLPDLDALFDELLSLGTRGWQMQLTVPMGRAAERPEWLLQPYELPAAYDRLAAIAKRGVERGLLFWAANNLGYYGPYEALLRGSGVDEHRVWSGCVAGKNALGLESSGAVKGCPSLPTDAYVGGNVRERSIARIREEAAALRLTRDRGVDALWGYCASCPYAKECMGGCTWTAHVFFGRAGNNPYCHFRALDHARRGLRERLVAVAPAPGVPFDHGRFEIVVEPADAPLPPARRLPIAP